MDMEIIDSVDADTLEKGDFILAENGTTIAEIVTVDDRGDFIVVLLENDDEMPFLPDTHVDIYGYSVITV
jgi:hypothetical protein